MSNRFKDFTYDELYMLQRQCIESSHAIVTKYSADEIAIHTKLINEITDSIAAKFSEQEKR